jgi:hypothetical protein
VAAQVYVHLTSGTTPGPFNIYEQSVNGNRLEANVTLDRLRQGIKYNYQPTTTQIVVVNMNPACRGNSLAVTIPGATPTPTPSPTPNTTPTLTPTKTPTNTPTPTVTQTLTSTPTPTLTPTQTNTPTPSSPARATITVNLTIDTGNTGYTQVYYATGSGGPLTLQNTLLTNGSSTTFTIPSGNKMYTITYQQTRAQSYQVAEAVFLINGSADAGSPYIQSTLGAACELISVPIYGGDGHPTLTGGNIYTVNTYIGNQR